MDRSVRTMAASTQGRRLTVVRPDPSVTQATWGETLEQSRRILVGGKGAHVYVEIEQSLDQPGYVTFAISGSDIEFVGDSARGVCMRIKHPEVLNAVVGAMSVAEEHGRFMGLFDSIDGER